jgi:hypothetical protein
MKRFPKALKIKTSSLTDKISRLSPLKYTREKGLAFETNRATARLRGLFKAKPFSRNVGAVAKDHTNLLAAVLSESGQV